jgi:addiction module HigA family antidote
MAVKLHQSFAIHPGLWLRTEIIEAHSLSVTEAAYHLGVTRQALTNLLTGKAGLSAEMAIRFEKVFDTRAEILLRMQMNHDLAQARTTQVNLQVRPIAA